MSQIAVGILAEPSTDASDEPIRDWAISVLQNPSAPPKLSDKAAERLRDQRLNWVGGLSVIDYTTLFSSIDAIRPLGDDFLDE